MKVILTHEVTGLGTAGDVVDVKDGGLKDVFVYVKSGVTGTYPAPTDAVELDQQGCMYKPHIVVLADKDKVEMEDEIRAKAKMNSAFFM